MNAAIIIPSIRVDPLLERCVSECHRLCADAEIVVLVDEGDGQERISSMAEVIVTGPLTIGAKRNLGAVSTSAEFLAFIDSDAYPDDGWLQSAVKFLENDLRFAAVGGPNISPLDEPSSERCVGLAHNSALVAGWWKYRRDRHARAREVGALPSCNLIVRAADYAAVDGMHEELFTAEDTDFCRRFTASGRRIWFSPDVLVFHKNRNMRAFAVQRFTFGVAMVPLMQNGTAPDVRYTTASGVLALFVTFLMSWPLALVSRRWRRMWAITVLGYAGLIGVETLRQVDDAADAPGTLLALVIGNLAPGFGVVARALGLARDLRGIYRNDR